MSAARGQALATVAIGGDRRVLELPASLAAFGARAGEPVLAWLDNGDTIAGTLAAGPGDALYASLEHDAPADARRATIRRPRGGAPVEAS